MRRSGLLLAVLALAVSGSAAAAAPHAPTRTLTPGAAAVAERPNILLVNLDDARYDALSYMPKTRSWLYNARDFSGARVTIPSCCPSRSTLFTGRYSHNNGVLVQTDAPKLDKDFTLMRYLKSAGYLTAISGKFLVTWPPASGPPYFDKRTVIQGGYQNVAAWVEGVSRQTSGYSTTFLGQQLRGYLAGFESQDATPWFAYFAPQAPHTLSGWKKLSVPDTKYAAAPVADCVQPGEADRRDKPAYLSWVAPDVAYVDALCKSMARTLMSVDDEINNVFSQIKAAGELANTMVIVTSDNGYGWNENGWYTKFVPYESSMRVPLMIRWDGHVTTGKDPRLASTIDITPTILGSLGITPLKTLDGRSLLSPTVRSDYLSEYFLDKESNGPLPTWAALTNGSRVYIEDYPVDASGNVSVFKEYYRLASDPGQNTNVLRDGITTNDPPASELSALATKLKAARTCSGTACP